MAIEFVVDLACTPKSQLGFEEWYRLVRTARRVDALRAQGAPDDGEVTISRSTDAGVHSVRLRVGDLARDAQRLAPLEPHCASCPARALPMPFGCVAAINYPFTAANEEWLFGRLPSDDETTAGGLLLSALEDYGWTGARVDALRARGMFERTAPLRRRVGDEVVTSSQLLEMCFFVGDLKPVHATLVALFLGAAPHDLDDDDLEAIMNGDLAVRQRAFAEGRSLAINGAAAEANAFVIALARAASLGVGVRIDA
jgi:hypothetical protein